MKVIFESSSLTIGSTLSRKNTPRIDGVFFQSAKNHVLGKQYDLSLVFVGKDRMRTLNREHRKKDYTTDILSFEIDCCCGEIFINPDKARSKAKEFDRAPENYLKFLFIHGLYHLKGMDHENDSAAKKMEVAEMKTRKKFKV